MNVTNPGRTVAANRMPSPAASAERATVPRVTLVSTWRAACGIATYSENLRNALEAQGVECAVEVLDREHLRQLSRAELTDYFSEMGARLHGRPVVHIQHEYGFFTGSYGMEQSLHNFDALLRRTVHRRNRVFVTFHSEPIKLPGISCILRARLDQARLLKLWRFSLVRHFQSGRVHAIAPSLFVRRRLIDNHIPPERIHVIPQGAPPLHSYDRDAAACKAALGFPPNARVLVVFGFVSWYKGHRVALQALNNLPPEYHLVIAGGAHPQDSSDLTLDKLLGYLERRSGLRSRVRVTGYLPPDQLPLYIGAADLCLAPYLPGAVATSASIMTLLASGKPVVASRIPAFEELNAAGECIRLVTPRAPRLLAQAVMALERAPEQGRALVAEAERRTAEHDWELVAARHLEAYG